MVRSGKVSQPYQTYYQVLPLKKARGNAVIVKDLLKFFRLFFLAPLLGVWFVDPLPPPPPLFKALSLSLFRIMGIVSPLGLPYCT